MWVAGVGSGSGRRQTNKNLKQHLFEMKRTLVISLMVGAMSCKLAATDGTWTNTGNITTPVVDATNVLNETSGNISTFTTFPFEMSNNRNVTNKGTMTGSVGFRFEHIPTSGPRRLLQNFVNTAGANITAFDGPTFSGSGSYLYVRATNLMSQGVLSASALGLIELVGTNINLNRGGVGINPISASGSANNVPVDGRFIPDLAVSDLYWAQTNMTFDSSEIIQPDIGGTNIFVISPPHQINSSPPLWQIGVVNPITAGFTNLVGGRFFSITNEDASITNIFLGTNITRQAAFVGVNDTNMGVIIGFANSTSPTNRFKTITVDVRIQTTNLVSQTPSIATIYFEDTLAAEPDRGLLVNNAAGTSRPANYLLSRITQGSGAPGNTIVTTNYLYDTNFAAPEVTGPYAAYGAFLDNLGSRPPAVPGGTYTNLPGRVIIKGDSLDLTRTRLRGEGWASVTTKHLVGSSNAVVDCENLSFFLGSTNGNLRISNLMKETVARHRGDVYAWSARWTNTISQIITNYSVDTNGLAVLAPITNNILVGFHALILDASLIATTLPVTVYDLQARSTNVAISDNGLIAQSFLIDGQSFTSSGALTLGGALQNWIHTNAPSLRYFTNTGSLSIPNNGYFGVDTLLPYSAFVNRGTIDTYSLAIRSEYLESSSNLFAAGSIFIDAGSAKLQGGEIAAGGDVNILGGIVRLNQQTISATVGELRLVVTNTLSDTGGGANNLINVNNGFALPLKPTLGDLLGTTLQCSTLSFAEAFQTWAGEDRGVSAAGYSNNVAVGRLVMAVGTSGLLTFRGASQTPGVTNALYVDFLEVDDTVSADLEGALNIEPNLIIYFADSNLPVETLDGLYGGRLRWVRTFAGPNSSVAVLLSDGSTIYVNRALRDSVQIDSDGDGLANRYDLTPFDPVPLVSLTMVTSQGSPHARLTWRAAANTVYTVQCSTNIGAGWSQVCIYTNTASSNGNVSVVDPVVATGGPRLYRVSYTP